MRNRLLASLFLVVAAAMAQAPAAAKLQFEVATIKPAAPLNPAMVASGKLHVGMNVDAARVDIGFLSLNDLILLAYKVKQHQLVGPDWMKNQRFDILAKMPEGATKEQVPEMLQGLASAPELAARLRPFLDPDDPGTVAQKQGLALVRERLGTPGASTRVVALAGELLDPTD